MLKVRQQLYANICIYSQIIFTAPGDYNQTVTTVIFGPGHSDTQPAVVPIIADDLLENDEVFYGNLRPPAGSQDRMERANATIVDDDSRSFAYNS